MSPVQRGSTPRAYDAHDIRHRLLQFDSQRLLHKNAPWEGTRYAIVFFNKDVNYRDDPRDKRSVKLQRAPPQPLDTHGKATSAGVDWSTSRSASQLHPLNSL